MVLPEVFSALEMFGFEEEKIKVKDWYDGFVFGSRKDIYNPWSILNFLDEKNFVSAFLAGDLDAMNEYMNRVSLQMFGYFDTGNRPTGEEPERFYHGFVLGLMTELARDYAITSNRESGFGRYDVLAEPKNKAMKGFVLEFKVYNPRKEVSLEDTLESALNQMEEKQYAVSLIEKGVKVENICKYGFAFKGKEVLVGER